MKTIAVVTVARSDFGIYKSVLRELESSNEFNLKLIVTGMHLEEKFGMTIKEISNSEIEISHQVKMHYREDTPFGVGETIASGVSAFSHLFNQFKPDYIMLLGDRFEMLATAIAALPFNIPIIHLHGGETTEGAIDEAIRHSITKMSHVHFASTENYRKRILQLGEEAWRVFHSGAPSLDEFSTLKFLPKEELEKDLNINLNEPTLIATLHPETLNYKNTELHATEFLETLVTLNLQTIITYPNADTSGSKIINLINQYARKNSNLKIVPNLGKTRYFSLLKYCSLMIGNSSSGIIEAASFKLPVINIGDRQRGRDAGANVIHVPHNRQQIVRAAKMALSADFKKSLESIQNPYVRGYAAKTILDGIKTISTRSDILLKKFEDITL